MILKLNYEKAYDRVSWNFIFQILECRGFSEKWISWIRQIVVGAFVGVMVNGEESSFFKPGKGLRQGDPISPLLFNLVSDVLTRMLFRASNAGFVKGLPSDFREGSILLLQYGNDTILFSSAEEFYLINLKHILLWFEQLSGMRINFHKSDLIPMNVEGDYVHYASHIFHCPLGTFPIKYLGVPLHYNKFSREDVQPLVDKMVNRIAG